MRQILALLAAAASFSAFGQSQLASFSEDLAHRAKVRSVERAAVPSTLAGDYRPLMYLAALRGITGSGGSGTISAGTVGQCAVYTGTTTIGGVDCPTLTGTPAAGDLSYWTSSSAQALFTPNGSLIVGGSSSAPTNYAGSTVTAGRMPTAISASGALTGTATPTLGASGTLGTLTFGNATSGTILLTPTTGALGTVTLTMPATSGTILQSGTAVTVAQGGTGGTAIQAATQNLNTPRIIYKQGLPMVYMASATATGSPAGTGAFTGLTALTGGVPTSAYCYMPAGANVDGASTAGWYYCTFSSTTAGTVYNNRYTLSSTPPTIPGSPTAPTTLTTWTGGTGSVDFVSFSVPANAMGINGALDSNFLSFAMTNNANVKDWSLVFGGTTVVSALTIASATTYFGQARVFNTGSASIQFTQINRNGTVNAGTASAINTGNAATTTLSFNKATATDNIVLQPLVFTIVSDGN